MKQNRSSVCRAEIIVVDDDPRLLFSMDYLFSVVCQMDVCLTTDICGIKDSLHKYSNLKLLIVSTSTDDSERATLIERAAGLQNLPFILVVDGSENPKQRIDAYLSGASDVIRKPISLLELYLRLKTRISAFSVCSIVMGDLVQSNWNTEVFLAEKAGLTASEAQIAHVLIESCGEVVSRNELSLAINGSPWEFGDRKFDVHVSSLRRKIDASLGGQFQVTTVHSRGYSLSMNSEFA